MKRVGITIYQLGRKLVQANNSFQILELIYINWKLKFPKLKESRAKNLLTFRKGHNWLCKSGNKGRTHTGNDRLGKN